MAIFCVNNRLFRIIPGDGLIQLNELKEVLVACAEENGLKFTDDQLDQLTQALYDDAVNNNNSDKDNISIHAGGGIRFEQLNAQMAKHPGLLENLSIRLVSNLIF